MAVDRKFGYLRVVLNCLQAYEANLYKVIFNTISGNLKCSVYVLHVRFISE